MFFIILKKDKKLRPLILPEKDKFNIERIIKQQVNFSFSYTINSFLARKYNKKSLKRKTYKIKNLFFILYRNENNFNIRFSFY